MWCAVSTLAAALFPSVGDARGGRLRQALATQRLVHAGASETGVLLTRHYDTACCVLQLTQRRLPPAYTIIRDRPHAVQRSGSSALRIDGTARGGANGTGSVSMDGSSPMMD